MKGGHIFQTRNTFGGNAEESSEVHYHNKTFKLFQLTTTLRDFLVTEMMPHSIIYKFQFFLYTPKELYTNMLAYLP